MGIVFWNEKRQSRCAGTVTTGRFWGGRLAGSSAIFTRELAGLMARGIEI